MSQPLPADDLDHILAHTRELWSELRDGRIFITGGTGFLGCWLVESLAHVNRRLQLGIRATVLTRNPGEFLKKMPHLAGDPVLELHAGDVRDFEFPPGCFSHIIHAGTAPGAPVPPLEMFDTIVAGTRRVLDFAVARGAGKLIFVSSGAVYGSQPPDLTHIPETYPGAPDPADPDSAYGEGKRAAELLCAIAHHTHGIEVKIARCFAFVGPHLPLDAHFAIGNFIRDALAGGPIRVKGDGAPLRSYLYAADLAIWLWTILIKGPVCRPYNVGSDEAVSIADAAHAVGNAQEPRTTVHIAGESNHRNTKDRYVPCCDRARELGLIGSFSLREQIQKTLAWHRICPGPP